MKKTITISLMFLLMVGFLSLPVKAQDEPKWCSLCGMDLKMYWKTNNLLTFKDGTKTQTCSIHCAALVYQKRAKEIVNWEVVDYETQKFTDAKKALFLIGSKLPGAMTAVSKIAFSSRDDAEKYRKEYGGNIGTFDDALKRALEGMEQDKKMITAKVSELVKEGEKLYKKHYCFDCHNKTGGITAVRLDTSEFAQKIDQKAKIKEAILMVENHGTLALDYTEKLSEKELHAITLYLWDSIQRLKVPGEEKKVPGETEVVYQPKAPGEKDRCPVCGMFVKPYSNWWAEIIYQDGACYFFDGCRDMFKFYLKPEQYGESSREDMLTKNQSIWVLDYYTLKWLDATRAFYVIESDILGPMGHELVPFDSEEDAEEFMQDHCGFVLPGTQREKGKILKFQEVDWDLLTKLSEGSEM